MTLGLLVASENVDRHTDTQDSCFISIDYAIIRSKAKVTDGQGHRNSHKMAIDHHWSWPTLCLNKMLIKLDEPSPVFYNFTSQNMCMIKFEKKIKIR